jgi:hypothetical protein
MTCNLAGNNCLLQVLTTEPDQTETVSAHSHVTQP